MTAAQLLRLARRRHRLSQAEVAERAGTSQPVISAYEHGRRDPSVGTLSRLVAATGERLELGLARSDGDLSPPGTTAEHAERLVQVLLFADAVPPRRRPAPRFPRMSST